MEGPVRRWLSARQGGSVARLGPQRDHRRLPRPASPASTSPVETDHRKRHLIDRYLDVLIPLEIKTAARFPKLKTRPSDDAAIEKILRKAKADAGVPLIGLFPGAGHSSRRWPLEQFAELADFLIRNDSVKVLVFVGPEEQPFLKDMRRQFPSSSLLLDQLTLPQLAAAATRLAAFVSNDTGPMHVAAAVGTPVVLLLDKRAPTSYLPQGDQHRVIYNNIISDISVDEVYVATRSILASGRTSALFAR